MPVAGATSGVGWETARILAERGAPVLVHGRTAEEARAATGGLIAAGVSEPHLCTYATDLTDSDTAEAMARAVVGTRPHLDVRACDERVGPAPPATGERLKRPQRRPEPGALAAAFPYTRLRKGPTMIELLPHRLPALSRWFPAGAPGPAALAEHVLTTGIGRFWADHAVQPRAIAVDCAAHVLLRGDPGALVPANSHRSARATSRHPPDSFPSSAPPSTGSCRGSAWSTYGRRNRPPLHAPPKA